MATRYESQREKKTCSSSQIQVENLLLGISSYSSRPSKRLQKWRSDDNDDDDDGGNGGFMDWILGHTKDQLTKQKARQCTLLSSPSTFHATACSKETWRPIPDKHTPPGRHGQQHHGNHTLICLGSMLARMGQSRSSCWRREELGLGHSAYTRSSASTCSGVYRTYLPESIPALSYPPPPPPPPPPPLPLPLRIATATAAAILHHQSFPPSPPSTQQQTWEISSKSEIVRRGGGKK
uniref:Uncharacterized protein n=1 Tax=Oryza meridionalis TaxID=40149 RepID=A0A0E0EZ05_9ORYZ